MAWDRSSAVYVWQRERHSLLTRHYALFPGFSKVEAPLSSVLPELQGKWWPCSRMGTSHCSLVRDIPATTGSTRSGVPMQAQSLGSSPAETGGAI